VHVGVARKVVAVGIDVLGLVVDVRLLHRHAIEDQLLVHQADAVARDADAALHEGLLDVHRIAEHDDIAALALAVGQHVFRNRARGAKASLSTSRWSPTSSVSSIEPVGMTNA
jgi:hypothetical protein